MNATWRDRLIVGSPLVGLSLLMAVSPGDDGPTICPFALCTGTACPGCGMTRAASALVRGDLETAMTLHPLVLLIIVQLTIGWVWYLLRRSGRAQPLSTKALNSILIGTGLVLVAVWLARLLTGTLPPV